MTQNTESSDLESVAAYGALLAQSYYIAMNRKYSRIAENISIESGALKREVSVDFRLPDFDAVFPGSVEPSDSKWIIPLWPMRKGQLLTDLRVAAQGYSVRVLGRGASMLMTRFVVGIDWQETHQDLLAMGMTPKQLEDLDHAVLGLIDDMVAEEGLRAREATIEIGSRLIERFEHPPRSLARLIATAKFIGKRHLLWIETDCPPGQVLRLQYSYRTRFAPELGSLVMSPTIPSRLYRAFKTFIGQTPSEYVVPISRHGLARSYHVVCEAPAHTFFSKFRFAYQTDPKIDHDLFREEVELAEAEVGGEDDSGGPFGHLYLYDMPSTPGMHLVLSARVMEVPPGTMGPVSLLVSAATLVAIFMVVEWPAITAEDHLQNSLAGWGVLVSAVAIWFGQHFHAEGRRNLPLAARGGLLLVGVAALFTIAIWAIVGTGVPGTKPLGVDPRTLFAVSTLAPLVVATAVVWWQRLHFYITYRRGQRRVLGKYGL